VSVRAGTAPASPARRGTTSAITPSSTTTAPGSRTRPGVTTAEARSSWVAMTRAAPPPWMGPERLGGGAARGLEARFSVTDVGPAQTLQDADKPPARVDL